MASRSIGWFFPVLTLALVAAGCRSPRPLAAEADQAVQRHLAMAQAAVLGKESPSAFTIERPSDTLRRRLILEQALPTRDGAPPTPSSPAVRAEPMEIALTEALQIAAFNSREYQNQKESVFSAALALDREADAFHHSLAGAINTLLSGERGEGVESLKGTAEAGVTLTRKLEAGATLTSHLALDVARLLTGSRDSSLGLSLDASISIPLLRGAGRAVTREPLTQAERRLLYALRRFERFKQEFAVRLVSEYLSVLHTGSGRWRFRLCAASPLTSPRAALPPSWVRAAPGKALSST